MKLCQTYIHVCEGPDVTVTSYSVCRSFVSSGNVLLTAPGSQKWKVKKKVYSTSAQFEGTATLLEYIV